MAKTPDSLTNTPEPSQAPPTPGEPGTPDTLQLTTRRRAQALAVCIAAAFLTLLDVSIVTVALPSMGHQLHLTSADATWSIAGYTLTFGLVLIPSGRIGDEFGRRKVFLTGMVLFIVTGVLCGFAPDARWLVAARLARGISAGLVAPQVVGLMHQMYPPRERGRAFGYYGATVALSTAIGPLLGGIILQSFGTADGWRWIFYLFIPLDVLALFLGVRILPQGRRSERRSSLDLVGTLVLGLAVTAVMLPLLQSGDWAHRQWWLLLAGVALLVVFVLRERGLPSRGRQPLVDLSLFRARDYWVGSLVVAAIYGGFTGIFIVLSLFLQSGLHYTALQASLCTVVFTIGSAVCGIISGRIVHRVGHRLVIGGTAATALGLAATALVAGTSSGANMGLVLAVPLLVAGCGAGCVIAANQTLALHRVPRREGSSAAGVYQTGMKIGTSLGVALSSSLYFGELGASHGDFAAAAQIGLAGAAALAAAAFLIALPGFTRGVRDTPASIVAVEEVEPAR
ncbi:MFS transporter [Actinacidiphila soli]|uniref:MFS transporter n=1 Tax=Actinacidiphila soli TaxID=2487275 RepID=UPI0013E386D9|nr:MFS transporter [Actinacidiphila soli]